MWGESTKWGGAPLRKEVHPFNKKREKEGWGGSVDFFFFFLIDHIGSAMLPFGEEMCPHKNKKKLSSFWTNLRHPTPPSHVPPK